MVARGTASGREEVTDPRADLRWGTIGALLTDAAIRLGAAEAIVDGAARLSYAELDAAVTAAARAFLAAGLEKGDRAAVWAPNGAPWIVAALGVQRAGGVLVPLNTRFRGEEAAYILRKSRARFLCLVGEFLGRSYPASLEPAAGAAGRDRPYAGLPDLAHAIVLPSGDRPGDGVEPSDAARPGEGPQPGEGRGPSGGPQPGGPPGRGTRLTPWDAFVAAGQRIPESEAVRRAHTVRPDDLSDMLFTSGTTGTPKGALCTHAQTLRAYAVWAEVVGLRRGDRYLIVNPFFHGFGYKAGWLASLIVGATILPARTLDVPRVLEAVRRERVTVLPGTPTLYQTMLEHPDFSADGTSSLRLAVTGAANVPPAILHRIRAELGFEHIVTGYGLTESSAIVSMCRYDDPLETVAATAGRPLPGLEVVTADSAGRPVPPGTEGEIWVRGYTVMKGYFDEEAETAATVDRDGWLHTGDVGVIDADGRLRITDRIKDMFIVGGFNAYPAEIEKVLDAHPGVARSAVVGVPDARLGEVGAAFVVPRRGARLSREDVIVWTRERLANYKVPRQVHLVGDLPVNAAGKVLKHTLRAGLAGPQAVTSPKPEPPPKS